MLDFVVIEGIFYFVGKGNRRRRENNENLYQRPLRTAYTDRSGDT
jgi:hypothetical protein